MPPGEIAEASIIIIAILSVFFSPAVIVGIVLRHRERMVMLKNRVEGAPAVLAELKNLRNELTELRETTTRYDMSFDAALQRVEQRMDAVEQTTAVSSYPAYGAVRPTAAEETPTILRRNA